MPLLSSLGDGPPPDDWTRRFGPLRVRARHAEVTVLVREAEPRFLKVHADPERGAREAAALGAGLPLVTPALRLDETTAAGERVLGLEDVREGAPALRRVPPEAIPACAALLAGLHRARLDAAPDADAWARQLARWAADPALSAPLQRALAATLPLGDALCHRDLHPSNWIFREGVPIGLIDWSSCGRADPEFDLAGLAFASDPARLDDALAAWAEASGRQPDPARAHLYLWLLAEQAAARKTGDEAAGLRDLARTLGRAPRPEAHGEGRHGRAVPKPAERSGWTPLDAPDLADLLRDLADAAPQGMAVYAGHSCNDVVRARLDDAPVVAKIYNKPVPPWLFALEAHLAEALAGRGVTVLAPRPLPGGGRLFRVGPRVAALYDDVGDARLGTANADLTRLAEALASLHRVGPLTERFPTLQGPSPDLFCGEFEDEGLPEPLRAPLASAYAELRALDARTRPTDLPQALVHGSVHRDHAGWHPERGVVLFDLEKLRRGPRLSDAVQSAYMAGYRNNDETLDPARIVRFLVAYHRALPLTSAERALLLPALLSCFFHDLRAMKQDDLPLEARLRHARVLAEVLHNRRNLAGALERYLEAP
ncbi:MAG: aminoglycoside phosphotransferase family protein [Alphaproteobacteria bacterium]|nr:aminoglycoside phosphotransferase family protein [Alphaproteobacteria bacterium]